MRASLKKIRPGIIVIAIIVVFIMGYAYFGAADLIKGPKITVTYPPNGATLNKGVIAVTGEAQRIATLFMNGRQIFTDKTGHFKETLLLAKGYNIIELAARDKFGRVAEQTLEVVFKQN